MREGGIEASSVQCVNNGLTSVRLAPRCHPAKFLRERLNSQTDYLGVNSDVYENPIQIYANGVARWTDLSPLHSLLSYYRNLQGAKNTFSIATSVGLCLKRSRAGEDRQKIDLDQKSSSKI